METDQPNNHQTYHLAHELGHYFGLLHTHEDVVPSNIINSCVDLTPSDDPLETGDKIADTPVDPYFAVTCQSPTCPTYSCVAPKCNGSNIAFNNILTNNVMSYYINCDPKVLTIGQKNRMIQMMNHPSRTFLFDNNPPLCNHDISDHGNIKSFSHSNGLTSSPLNETPLRDIRININNDTYNIGFTSISSAQSNGKYSNVKGSFTNNVHANLQPVKTISPVDNLTPNNYRPSVQTVDGLKMAVDLNDVTQTQEFILGKPGGFTSSYSKIAADLNNSGTITSFDMSLMRSHILGASLPPAGIWRFISEQCFSDPAFSSVFFSANPFNAVYQGGGYATANSFMDNGFIDMGSTSASLPKTWSFRAIRVGDVNGSGNTLYQNAKDFPALDRTQNIEFRVESTENCIKSGDIITVKGDFKAEKNIRAFQFSMDYNKEYLEILGGSKGVLADFDQDSYFLDKENGNINVLWYSTDGKALKLQKNGFLLHFKALNDFCNLNEIIRLNKNGMEPIFLNENKEKLNQVEVELSYKVEKSKGNSVKAYPNPATKQVFFDIASEADNKASIVLSDYSGNTLTVDRKISLGNNTIEINDLSRFSGNIISYAVKLGSITYAGTIIRK